MMIKWVKGYDFMDETPRYSFEGRDPQDSLADIKVVIYTQRERKFSHDSQSTKNFYYGYIRHEPSETVDEIGRFETLKEAKQETEKLLNEYYEKFPNDTQA
ncbi:hypothetical protein [Bacillus altitudinis]|uniref:hypothetical protein n=1 Tax=Bacillus altitudinis TaxID=293387 RepID=UPI0011A08FAA|nr:hypothetical protein [Bacillus altitudinis]